MSKVYAYIEIEADKVLSACRSYIKSWEEKQEKARKDWIAKEMSKRWFPAKTEEQAERRAQDISRKKYSIGGVYWVRVCKSVMFQAEVASKTNRPYVLISDDVCDCIGEFLINAERQHQALKEVTND